MKRIYLVTGSIILLLLLVGVLFAWQKTVKAPEIIPTPKPTPVAPVTTGWKTYENKEFGFAFDYPGGWKVTQCSAITGLKMKQGCVVLDSSDYTKTYIGIGGLQDTPSSGSRIILSVYKNNERPSVADLIKSYGIKNNEREFTLQGHKVISFDAIPYEGSEIETAVLIEGNEFYLHIERVYPSESQKNRYEKTFDQILNTIKFLE